MPKDLTVILQDRPGELARLGEATGEAGVNIQGMCAFTGEGRGVIHLLVDDDQAGTARRALEEADMGVVDEREVLVVDVEDRPGTLGELARSLGEVSVEHRARLYDLRRRQARDRHRRHRQRPRGARLDSGPDRLVAHTATKSPRRGSRPGDVLCERLEGARRSARRPRRSGRSRASTPPRRPGVMKMPWFMW